MFQYAEGRTLSLKRNTPLLIDFDSPYVYTKKENGINVYYSTKQGILNDKTGTRQEFINFLSSAKISLLSAPGIDGSDNNCTGGFNPVTPRFYESAVQYCYMVGRFLESAVFFC